MVGGGHESNNVGCDDVPSWLGVWSTNNHLGKTSQ